MKHKVLVVDDERDVNELLTMRLVSNGYDVLNAYDGEEAIRIAKREKPDLILLDILMPKIDGAKTAEFLREMPETKDIPVVFITCLFTKEDEAKDNIRGGIYFIAKPYNGDQLLNVIKENIGI